MNERSEFKMLVVITLFVAALVIGLEFRKAYAEWACESICRDRGGTAVLTLETIGSRCACSK